MRLSWSHRFVPTPRRNSGIDLGATEMKRATRERGSVRIIGGHWRGRRLELPARVDMRPTPDRVRETLFNWLAPCLPAAACLDLFAGSGALAFEALSRGAHRAVLVDRDAASVRALETFRAAVGHELEHELHAEVAILRADAASYLAGPGSERFDIAFVDPPYAMPAEPVLRALVPRLKTNARVYLERARDDVWPEVAGLEWIRKSAAGAVAFGLAALIGGRVDREGEN
jgi:16S rRNA (guanine966-N2)-methyltransferase